VGRVAGAWSSGRAVRLLAHGLAEAAADDRLAADAEVRRAIVRLRTVAEDLVQRVAWAEQMVSSLVSTILGLTAQRTNNRSTRQAKVAQRISAYALLFAIPTRCSRSTAPTSSTYRRSSPDSTATTRSSASPLH
jgi:hypothetical protein